MIKIQKYIFGKKHVHIDSGCFEIKPLYITSNIPLKKMYIALSGITIDEYPLEFCNKICKLNKNSGNKTSRYVYKLPWTLLKNNPCYKYNCIFSPLRFTYEAVENNSNEIVVLYCQKFRVNRNKWNSNNSIVSYNQFGNNMLSNCKTNTDIDATSIRLSIKGIFLDNIDIDSLKSFEMKMAINYGGTFESKLRTRIKYDRELLLYATHKISENCLYIPFDNKLFNDMNYEGSFHTSSLKELIIHVGSEKDQTFAIRYIQYNCLIYNYNMCGTMFSS